LLPPLQFAALGCRLIRLVLKPALTPLWAWWCTVV